MGAVFALFAGFYYWTPKIIGKTYNELLGKIHFWTLFCGVNLTGKKYYDIELNLPSHSFSSQVGGMSATNLLRVPSRGWLSCNDNPTFAGNC